MILRRLTAALAAITLLTTAGSRAAEPAKDLSVWGPKIMSLPVHEQHVEQGILLPIPIRVALPDEIELIAGRVLVSYRLWGEPDWTTIQLRPAGQYFEGTIPCLEVSTVTGDFRYYVRVHDKNGHVIAQGGSRAAPYIVVIKNDPVVSPSQPRAKCPDPTSCPPGLPGCPSETVAVVCESDADCEGDTECSRHGVCVKASKKTRFVLSAEQDFGLIATTGACAVASQESEGYACYRADGARYAGAPVYTNEPLKFGVGTTRIVAGVDRLVSWNTSLGLRVGWTVRGQGPTLPGGTPFVPISFSARATHWFGDDPFETKWIRPFAFITGGYSMVDVKTSSLVREDPTAGAKQAGNDLEQTATVWKRAGNASVGVGGGLSFIFAPRKEAFVEGLFVEIAVSELFPYGATIVSPNVGIQLLP